MISVRKTRGVNVSIENCYGYDAITVELLDKYYDTLTDIIKRTSICTTDEVIRVLDSVGSFTVEA